MGDTAACATFNKCNPVPIPTPENVLTDFTISIIVIIFFSHFFSLPLPYHIYYFAFDKKKKQEKKKKQQPRIGLNETFNVQFKVCWQSFFFYTETSCHTVKVILISL